MSDSTPTLPELPKPCLWDSTEREHGWDASQVHEIVRAAVADAVRVERERCMGAMDSHGRYWVENRGRILDAISAAGFQLVSTKHAFHLLKHSEPTPATTGDAEPAQAGQGGEG